MRFQAVGSSPSPNVAFLLYAVPGTGKTRFVGTGKDTLIIRPPQDRTDSIRGPAERNIQEMVVTSHDDLEKIVVMASAGELDRFQWVWCDSISLLQDQTLDRLWQEAQDRNPRLRGQQPDVQTYGINIHRLGSWIRAMAGMGTFNFGVTAHPYWGKNLDDDDLLMPWVQGRNMPEKVCGSMNVVGYMEVKKLKTKGDDKPKLRRVIRFNVTDRFYAKDQFDAFPDGSLVDPTMPRFERAIKAARTRDTKTSTRSRVSGKRSK